MINNRVEVSHAYQTKDLAYEDRELHLQKDSVIEEA